MTYTGSNVAVWLLPIINPANPILSTRKKEMKLNHKRTTIILRLIIAILVLGLLSGCAQDATSEDLMRRAIVDGREAAEEAAAEFQRTDQITTVLCGTASPISRSGAQTCTAVFVNGQFLVFDVGNNAQQAMYDANMPIQEVDAVFLTHYHNDHIADLGELIQNSWISGREHTLEIY